MNVHPPEGWHFIQASQKRHYFQGGPRESTRYHLAYNLVLVLVATAVLVIPSVFGLD